MPEKRTFARVAVVVGLILMVVPVLTASSGDWLLPAELFPFVLAGGVLVTLAAPRGSSDRRLGGIGLLLSGGALVLGTLVMGLLGLVAPEAAESLRWQTGTGIAVLAVYALGVVLMLATGWFVARGLFGKRPVAAGSAEVSDEESGGE
ncbi:MAG: hypothetical protein ACYC77_11260 [Coriobacteriia bacterium]